MFRFLPQLILFLLAIAAFSLSLLNGFAFDDVLQVQDNPLIRSFSSVDYYWKNPAYPGDLYRPVVFFSYYLNFLFSGNNPFAYHLINVLAHSFVSILLFLLLRKIASKELSFMAAALFALHPLHSEVVANVSGRAEIFAAFGILLALYLVGRFLENEVISRKKTFAVIVFFAALFALFSKESALSLLLLMPLYIVFVLRKSCTSFSEALRKFLVAKNLICVISVIFAASCYLIIRFFVLGSIASSVKVNFLDNPLVSYDFFSRFLIAAALLGKYFLACIFPLKLSSDYSYAELAHFLFQDERFSFLAWGLHFLVVPVLGILAIKFRKSSLLLFALLWFLAAFAITSNVLIPIGTIYAERLAYLPSVAGCILLAQFLLWLKPSYLRALLGGSIVVFFIYKTNFESLQWKDNQSLYQQQIISASNSAKANLNYGRYLESKKKTDEALSYYLNAIKIYPDYAYANFLIAEIYFDSGRIIEARKFYALANKVEPKSHYGKLGLAKIAILEKNYALAEDLLHKAVALRPVGLTSHVLLVQVYLRLGKVSAAQRLFNELLKYNAEDALVKKLRSELEKSGVIKTR